MTNIEQISALKAEQQEVRTELAYKVNRMRHLSEQGADRRILTRHRTEILALTEKCNQLAANIAGLEDDGPQAG